MSKKEMNAEMSILVSLQKMMHLPFVWNQKLNKVPKVSNNTERDRAQASNFRRSSIDETNRLIGYARSGDIENIELLLKSNPNLNINSTNESGFTALHDAVYYSPQRPADSVSFPVASNGHKMVIKLLLERKANVNLRCDGHTPLQLATERNAGSNVISQLIEAKADLTVCDNADQTVLHLIAMKVNTATQEDALVTARTFFHCATAYQCLTRRTYLGGLTPYELAINNGFKDLAEFYRSKEKEFRNQWHSNVLNFVPVDVITNLIIQYVFE
jgi:ankyrin repeat protein